MSTIGFHSTGFSSVEASKRLKTKVVIPRDVYSKIEALCEAASGEVYWVTLVDIKAHAGFGNVMQLRDVFVPKQEATIGSIDFEATLQELANEIIEKDISNGVAQDNVGDDVTLMRCFCHKHPGQGVGPSSTDDRMTMNLLENGDMPWFLEIIFSEDASKYNCRFLQKEPFHVYDKNVEVEIAPVAEAMLWAEQQIQDKVSHPPMRVYGHGESTWMRSTPTLPTTSSSPTPSGPHNAGRIGGVKILNAGDEQVRRLFEKHYKLRDEEIIEYYVRFNAQYGIRELVINGYVRLIQEVDTGRRVYVRPPTAEELKEDKLIAEQRLRNTTSPRGKIHEALRDALTGMEAQNAIILHDGKATMVNDADERVVEFIEDDEHDLVQEIVEGEVVTQDDYRKLMEEVGIDA